MSNSYLTYTVVEVMCSSKVPLCICCSAEDGKTCEGSSELGLGFPSGPLSQVSGKMDLRFQVSKFPGFRWFSLVAQLEQPLETETQDY